MIKNRMNKCVLVGMTLLAVTACSNSNNSLDCPLSAEEYNAKQIAESRKNSGICSIVGSSNWQASIMENGNSYILNITGDVETPTPGYNINFAMTKADKSAIPSQSLELTTEPPEGMVIQVLTTTQVDFKVETSIAKYRDISIYCGGDLLIKIDDVE